MENYPYNRFIEPNTGTENFGQKRLVKFKIIGYQGNEALFLVIQHADLAMQIKYLPMMKEAVKKGDVPKSELALLEDRIRIAQGKKQIYGSQIGRNPQTGKYFVKPIIEPEKVNNRRAKVGLQPIEKYVKHWGINWNIKKHTGF